MAHGKPRLKFGEIYSVLIWRKQPPVDSIYLGKNNKGDFLVAGRIARNNSDLEIRVYRFNEYKFKDKFIDAKYNGSKYAVANGRKPNPFEEEYLKKRFDEIEAKKSQN
ncbi:MAG: hypothetical protein AABW50_02950 [Nanoarchaeota archaeon]|mgnify:CR=1 FL=1